MPLRLVGPAPSHADGRFAPSPTGSLHLGNLRTALLAWLFARAAGAHFVVRIEDLDAGRSRERFVTEQLSDLAAIGLDWDGPVIRQSERGRLYEDAVTRLRSDDLLYECWCTRAEIRAAVSAPHADLPEGAYPGTCRDISRAERARREASGRPPALRVRAQDAQIGIVDRVHGAIGGTVDDLVVRRGDGAHAYNLAVVVDDHDQNVGEVVRGDDLLSSTPSQAWLAQRLGLSVPGYAHVPLVLGDDGARLAKRHGAVTLADQAQAGRTPAGVVATFAAQLDLAETGESPAPGVLVERFRDRVLRAGSRYEPIPGSPA